MILLLRIMWNKRKARSLRGTVNILPIIINDSRKTKTKMSLSAISATINERIIECITTITMPTTKRMRMTVMRKMEIWEAMISTT